MQIEHGEAESLLKAASVVADQYDYSPNPKAIAWITLAGTVGMIYGPRFVALRLRLSMERQARATPPAPPPEPPQFDPGSLTSVPLQ